MHETMRDRGKFWRPAPDARSRIERDDFRAEFVQGLGQALVSGNLAAARAALASGAREIGLWDVAHSGPCWVRIARDRALLVSPQQMPVEPAWRDGYVATPFDDACSVLELSGTAMPQVIAEATSVDLEAGSRSAAILFAGVTAFLYRLSPDRARLHVESPFAAYVWTWLEDRR